MSGPAITRAAARPADVFVPWSLARRGPMECLHSVPFNGENTVEVWGVPGCAGYDWLIRRGSDGRVVLHSEALFGQIATALHEGLTEALK